MTTVREMITQALKEAGCDALYNEDAECGCVLEDMPLCEHVNLDGCEAGVKVPCEYGDNCDFDIVPAGDI